VRGRAAAAAILLALAACPARGDDPFLRRTATVRAVEKVGPAVVNITSAKVVQGAQPFQPFARDPFFDRFFQDFFERSRPRTAQSLGSGVVIDDQRHVLTNEHVIAGADRILVTLADGRELEATLVGADPNNDLAVLRIESDETVPWIPMGSSADLLVGEPVIAIGNPFGLSNTVTTGVLSAADRSMRTDDRTYHGFLQTDASINPGNSGGPLLNAEGELIGINTAIYGGGAQGIGFAIPIDAARRIVQELLVRGELAPVDLGMDVQDLDPRIGDVLELPKRLSGALVSRVGRNGPAERAGVQRGDLLVKIEGRPLASSRDFYETLERSTPGQTLALELWRAGETRQVAARAEELSAAAIQQLGEERLGLRLEPAPGGGFQVTQVRRGSGAERIGIAPGDLLLGINGRALQDPETLRRSVLALRGRDRALVVVQRGRGRYHVAIPLG
jgi:serine protease Do